MEPWKERLINEQKDLKEKLVNLTDFINSSDFYQLSPNNRQLLKNQKIAMELYLNVLNMRVFEDVDNIFIPDYGFMQMMGSAFSGSPFGVKTGIDNFLAALSTQMGGTWSRTFNENTGKHEFTFTPNANTNEAES